MEKGDFPVFRSKDLDLITVLRFKGFLPRRNPIVDPSGTRWVEFEQTPKLTKAVYSFLSGNPEARLLQEFRRTRQFLLDTAATDAD